MTTPLTWLQACKIYKEQTGKWIIPKPGTAEHQAVNQIILDNKARLSRSIPMDLPPIVITPNMTADELKHLKEEHKLLEHHYEYLELERKRQQERHDLLERTEIWKQEQQRLLQESERCRLDEEESRRNERILHEKRQEELRLEEVARRKQAVDALKSISTPKPRCRKSTKIKHVANVMHVPKTISFS
jgi:hypothetical protein